jgi:GPH family glycoside/pentoside/hexuronide:cation symporter
VIGRQGISLGTKLAYGIGQVAEGVKNNTFELFLFFYYNQVLGLSGALAGLALFIALCLDAVTDPVIGSLSDGWRSRWGRRHPMMYLSAAPLAIAFYALFAPPANLPPWALFAWLTGFAILVRVAMSFYQVPHLALGAELSDDYEERTAIVGYRTAFGLAGGAALIVIGFSVFFKATPEFPNGQLNRHAYPEFAAFFALVMWASIWWSAAGTHRMIPRLPKAVANLAPFRLARVAQQLRAALRNQSFRILFLSMVLFFLMRGVQNTLALHATTFFWELAPGQIQVVTLAIVMGLLAGIPLAKPLNRRVDKKWLFIGGALWALLFHVAPVMFRLWHWLPGSGDPALTAILVVAGFFGGMGAVQCLVAAGSMIADICDEQELATGLRQEGMLFGGLAFAGKAASGLGHSVAGLGIDAIGFPVGAEPGTVSAGVVHDLALIYGPGVGLIGLLAVLLFARYRLTRRRIGLVQRRLHRRRTASGETTV